MKGSLKGLIKTNTNSHQPLNFAQARLHYSSINMAGGTLHRSSLSKRRFCQDVAASAAASITAALSSSSKSMNQDQIPLLPRRRDSHKGFKDDKLSLESAKMVLRDLFRVTRNLLPCSSKIRPLRKRSSWNGKKQSDHNDRKLRKVWRAPPLKRFMQSWKPFGSKYSLGK